MPPKKKKRPLFQSPIQTTDVCGRQLEGSETSVSTSYGGTSIKRKCKRQSLSNRPHLATLTSKSLQLDPSALNISPPTITSSPFNPHTITSAPFNPNVQLTNQFLQPSTMITFSNHSPPPSSPVQPTHVQSKPSPVAAANVQSESFDNEDLLFGLCPEDLSFSLNTSMLVVDSAKTSSGTKTTSSASSSNNLHTTNTVTAEIHDTENEMAIGQDRLLVSQSTTASTIDSNSRQKQVLISGCFEEVCVPESPGMCRDKVQVFGYQDDTFYGLPLTVKSCLKEYRGIDKLYDWQQTCLCLPSVIRGSNLIYSLPTSGGKTLVAEIIILQQLLTAGRDVLFILPFVSIVQEKVRELSPFAVSLGFIVEEYAASKGRIPPRNRRKKHVVYIATIEKANGLVNSLVEMETLGSLGLVVVDELHMIGDGTVRGATLEICLAKVLHCSGDTQVIGMSATLSNIDELAQFLRADVYSNDFRPVELLEYVKIGRCVYSVKGGERGVVNLNPTRDIQEEAKMDPDQICSLVAEVIPQSSCLVFCPTKKNCQNVALLLAKHLPKAHRHVKKTARQNLLKLLSIEAAGVCPILAQTVPSGIAYHHSGLTADERRIIEEGYLEGTLCLLACTSTLAAGVNLPAKRVILRSPFIGNKFLSRSQYKQMIGRAGRSGLCEKGESILILREQDKIQALEILFSGPYDNCASSLLTSGSSILLSLILSLVGLKVVKTFAHLKNFLQFTLLSIQTDPVHLDKSCQDALFTLAESGYITVETGETPYQSSYCITSLGRATYKGCLAVEVACMVYDDLIKGQQGLVLTTDLHLLFLTTPPDLCTSIQPNWMIYFEKLTSLGSDGLKVAELVGVKPGVLSKKATGTSGKMSSEVETLYRRFYISLILHHLLKSTSSNAIWRTADSFQCSRGFLQSVMNSTSSFASCLTHFTQEIPDLWSINLLLPSVTKKLAYSASLDLVPLMEITGVKQGRARQLVAAGITTPHKLASADPEMLCESIDHLYLKQARKLIQAAKRCVSEQAEVLMEEAEELMSLVSTSPGKHV